MDTNRIKLGLTYIFKESTDIPKKAKLNLINFIEGANDTQIKVLAMDGEIIPKDAIDEIARQIIDDRFNTSTRVIESIKKASVKGLNEVVGLAAVGAGAIAAGAAGQYMMNMKKIKAKCSQFKGNPEQFKNCVTKGKALFSKNKKAGVKN